MTPDVRAGHAPGIEPATTGIAVGRSPALLDVRDLRVEFAAKRPVHAVRGLTYSIAPGEALGLVGESGSGKSVSALALLGLLPKRTARVSGTSAAFDGVDLLRAGDRALETIRGRRIGMVFQDPLASLNPVLTVGEQLSEPLRRHRGKRGRAARLRSIELLEMVGIPGAPRRISDYPHQFSGGMRQRAMIAMALSCEPALLIADEPTTALDVTIQAQILDLLRRLRTELGMALLLITHDLGVVAGITDRIAVMYAGRIVETGSTRDLLAAPTHPYTAGLLRSLPRLDRPRQRELTPIEGSPPDLASDLVGCPFRPRCPRALGICATVDPPLAPIEAAPGRLVACHSPVPPRGTEAVA